MILAVWVTIVGFVGFAVYRQMRAHMELRRSLRDFEKVLCLNEKAEHGGGFA